MTEETQDYSYETNVKWCISCKEIIERGQPFVTEIIDGEKCHWHKHCYDLEHPREEDELNFG